jgi:murein DD-endopeptidase MepM/ murein hydrolase activator NlpD
MGARALAASAAFALAVPAALAPVTVGMRARSIQPGELVVLTITLSEPRAEMRVRAFDRDQPAFPMDDGHVWRALVGIDLDVAPGRHAVSIEAEGVQATHLLTVTKKTFPTRSLKVDEAFVNPPDVMRERIDAEAKQLETTWASPAPERLWTEPFVRPVPQPANSQFGTRSVYNGTPRSPHGGADFLSPAGTPVRAPNAGRVAIARELYFTGNTIVIDHGLGLFSMLAHLSAIDVHESDVVSAGQLVGRVGATGRVTGPHLHWAVRAGGARVDPLSVLTLLGSPPQTPQP